MTRACDWLIKELKRDGLWTPKFWEACQIGPPTFWAGILIEAAMKFREFPDAVMQDFMVEITRERFPREGRKNSNGTDFPNLLPIHMAEYEKEFEKNNI